MSDQPQDPRNPTSQEVTPDDFSLDDLVAWQQFYQGVKTRNRFILEKTADRFVRDLVRFARSSKFTKIKQGQKLFRGRINPEQIADDKSQAGGHVSRFLISQPKGL